MAIDTSIYAQQAPVTTPNVGDTMQQVMTLKNLGLQNQNAQLANQQAQLQMQNQQAIRQAYANNVGEDGTVDQKGVLSDLARNAPQAYMQTAQGMTAMQKAQAEATTAKMAALHQTATITAPNYDYLLNKLSDEQAAQAYPTIVHQMAQQGVDIGNLPPTWNRDKIQQAYDVASKFKEQMDNALTAANTQKANQEADMVGFGKGADELHKFKDDVLTPSIRKPAGQLQNAILRTGRIISLANQGAPPNETEDQRIQRLNGTMPQMANEYSAAMASLFQGGQPDEATLKATGLGTIDSAIAEAKQKWSANPTAGNQGALINAYINASKTMRDYSQKAMKDISDHARSAYPFANKYYSKEMDNIAASIGTLPAIGDNQSGTSTGGRLAGSTTSGGLIPSANASEGNIPAAKSPPKYSSGDLVMYGGRHYKIGPDGDSLVPIQGAK